MNFKITSEEILGRQKKFLEEIERSNLDAAILFSPTDIFYLTNFMFRPSERPITFFIDSNKETHLFVPMLEHSHAENYAVIDNVHSYPEYPGIKHPMEYLKEVLMRFNMEKRNVGIDSGGYNSAKGYSGPAITNILGFKKTVSIKGLVERLRYVKSEKEVELIKTSAYWGNIAHEFLVEFSKEGVSEIEIEGKASFEATKKIFEEVGEDYKPYGNTPHAFYRGQIGPHSAFPHSQSQNAILKKGYNVVSQAACDVWSYKSELERTMFVKEYSSEQEKYFNHMYNAQEIAFKEIKPGKPASDIEKSVQEYFKFNNLTDKVRHHTGHNIGLLNHEAPFFDLGDHTILEKGMVFSVEPGIYVDGLGAFRHSDTIVVTEEGCELLTTYPRDIDSLIIG